MFKIKTKKTATATRMNADLGLGSLLNFIPSQLYIPAVFLKA
jgi:hypothetical protein